MKKTLFLLLLSLTAWHVSAQVTVLRSYTPAGGNVIEPATTPTPQETPADAAARRSKALSKVQGTMSKKTLTSKGGLSPAQYSTDATAPVEYSSPANPSTTMTVNGLNMQRSVRKGKGQVGNNLFTPVSELHFVQFAVYCKDTPVDKAPTIDGLFLLWHEGSKCPGGAEGASYIVKGYNTAEEAKSAVLEFKAQRIDCWYNPSLTGAEVEVIGVR